MARATARLMALTSDIVATYKGPSKVIGRFLAQGRNEVRALLFVLIAGVLMFIAAAPYQAREAQLNPAGPLEARLYWSAFLFIFIIPLLLYGLAALIWVVTKVARMPVSGFEVRFTLFWALLASAPVMLLFGLVAGLIGQGVQLQLVSFIWLAVFGWFWISGLLVAARTEAA
ncbi:YIP1 family protein [uncultured Sulfitobacter sp.]|uniref:YIP1 family protein n=1 Tax=uncultured Sulfitobacter sp. TaxID=191468 RepID=UPI00260D31A3|nr:YIP1 family protein [uncultured Sulfitobacter sp.]